MDTYPYIQTVAGTFPRHVICLVFTDIRTQPALRLVFLDVLADVIALHCLLLVK